MRRLGDKAQITHKVEKTSVPLSHTGIETRKTMNRNVKTLLNAVVAVGVSPEFQGGRYRYFTFYIEASAVTTGGTMKIQSKAPNGTWCDVDSRAISANGTTVVTLEGSFDVLRANLSARTDGTFTVSVDAAG